MENTITIQDDVFELYALFMSTFGLNVEDKWTHDELVGKCYLMNIKVTWNVCDTNVHIYHFHEMRNTAGRSQSVDDMIVRVNYNDMLVSVIAPPRPFLGYLVPEEWSIITWPVCDGTTFRLFYSDSQWIMSSKNSIKINESKLFDKTFEELFFRLAGVDHDTINNKYSKDTVYTMGMTTIENCPYKDTKDALFIFEETQLLGTSLITTLHKADTQESEFGVVYRTNKGVYIDITKKYKSILKVIYGVNTKDIKEISADLGVSQGITRKVYAIVNAIITGNDNNFGKNFPKWKNDHGCIHSFIGGLVRQVYNQCMVRIKNPYYPRTADTVSYFADLIGPLKTANGLQIVQDTLYNHRHSALITSEYIRNLNPILNNL